jgi:hypothetical protein
MREVHQARPLIHKSRGREASFLVERCSGPVGHAGEISSSHTMCILQTLPATVERALFPSGS